MFGISYEQKIGFLDEKSDYSLWRIRVLGTCRAKRRNAVFYLDEQEGAAACRDAVCPTDTATAQEQASGQPVKTPDLRQPDLSAGQTYIDEELINAGGYV